MFAAHVVEHLSLTQLQQFFTLCREKLQPHTYVIVETPNPQSLYTLSQHFYKDMSHEKPLDPGALLHLIKTLGFQEARIELKNPFPNNIPYAHLLQEVDLSALPDAAFRPTVETFNANIRQLNALVYGYLDYAIIAQKLQLF